uniref:Uncharacterized protein n=1 Tax=Anguilla anguilla TaxID=7936 RepID=A0A0E9VIG0_ANGAN
MTATVWHVTSRTRDAENHTPPPTRPSAPRADHTVATQHPHHKDFFAREMT